LLPAAAKRFLALQRFDEVLAKPFDWTLTPRRLTKFLQNMTAETLRSSPAAAQSVECISEIINRST
jgi:hypothetical protein